MAQSIAVAGKGGTGKSTIAALLVRHLTQQGQGPVLAVDADPDANLGTLLGVHSDKSVGDMRESMLKEIKKLPAGMSKQAYLEAGLHQIIAESAGFDLITMGRGEGPGCYCYLNSLIRKFSENLLPSYSWVVIDNEAGLEHLSRRTTVNIDTLLVVVGENPLTFETARSIERIVSTLQNGIRQNYLVTNLVRPEKLPLLEKRIAETGLECIGNIPRDSALEDATFAGHSLVAHQESPATIEIDRIMKLLQQP